MGLLDEMMGAALGGNGKNNPLGDLLGGLGGLAGGGGNPLGDLLKQFGGGDATQSAGLMAALMGLVQQMGGFEALLQRFQQAGLGAQASSWLSTGPNSALDATQLGKVFGPEALSQFASQAGLNGEQASSAISRLLPELVDRFSPQGALAGNHADLLQQGMELFFGARR